MRAFKAVFTLLIFMTTVFGNEADPVGLLKDWDDDLSHAVKIAEEKGCPVLIAFLGPNWCEFSDKLEEEILSNAGFIGELKEKVILMRVDIPEDFEGKNFYGKDLKERYHINECPSVVIVHPSGHTIAKLQYLPIRCGELAAYIDQVLSDYDRISHLQRKEIKHLKVDELQHLYTRAGYLADQTFKKALLDQGLKVDRGPYFLLQQYGNLLTTGSKNTRMMKKVRGKILARDPKNQQGCLLKLALLDFESLAAVGGKRQASQVVKPLVEYLKKFGVNDRENSWQLEMKISQYFFSRDQVKEALKHAQISYEAAPSDEKKEIAQSIEYLQSFIE